MVGANLLDDIDKKYIYLIMFMKFHTFWKMMSKKVRFEKSQNKKNAYGY